MRRSILSAIGRTSFVALAASPLGLSSAASAQQAEPAPAWSAEPVTLATPAMAGFLVTNPHPTSFDAGSFGKIYVTGALNGLAVAETNPFPRDRRTVLDLGNGQVFVQKIDGLV